MNRTIFKYPFDLALPQQTIKVARSAVPLHAGLDPNGQPVTSMLLRTAPSLGTT